MGQEYGEPAPFPYFVSHSDPALIEAVRKGRREEFASFTWDGDPPDPQSEHTYRSAILDWSLRRTAGHAALLEVYRTLLGLRREIRSLTSYDRIEAEIVADGTLVLRRHGPHGCALLALNLSPGEVAIDLEPGQWRFRFDSAAALWDGPADVRPDRPAGSLELWPHSAVLLTD
jgi:maltooligosyltrehalose trehalohydrolase